MAFDFPANPAIGDTVVPPNGYTYVWDGVKWKIVPATSGGGDPGGGGGTPTPYVNTFNTRHGDVVLSQGDVTAAGGAPITSPAFGGTPLAPTAGVGTSTRQIATTEFVAVAVANVSPGGGGGTSFPEAPTNGAIYGRGGTTTAAWHEVIPIDGGTVDGGNF